MRRREFIAGLGATGAWPLVATGQQGGLVRRLGYLNGGSESAPSGGPNYRIFVGALAELGWVDGRNLRIDVRWAEGSLERMRVLAQELVDRQPDVIVARPGPAVRAVQAQTRTIPIVFIYAGDPIVNGYLTNIARPEGNITGVTDLFPSIGSKWMEFLKQVKPSLARVALVFNPDFLNETTMVEIEATAAHLGVKAVRIAARDSAELGPSLETFAVEPDGGVIPVPPVTAIPRVRELVNEVALRHRLPTIYNNKQEIADGGLMSYGGAVADLFRHGGPDYVNRILHGAKPGDLPVQFSSKFELVINLKTARATGVTIPDALLATADEVIE
jgi:putative tryptophan/tyrosine transport system substrate-binding protein